MGSQTSLGEAQSEPTDDRTLHYLGSSCALNGDERGGHAQRLLLVSWLVSQPQWLHGRTASAWEPSDPLTSLGLSECR